MATRRAATSRPRFCCTSRGQTPRFACRSSWVRRLAGLACVAPVLFTRRAALILISGLRLSQSALLVSPFVNLVSYAPSRRPAVHLDLLHDGGVFNAALHYVGAVAPLPLELTSKGWRAGPSWNPLQWFSGRPSCDSPPEGIVDLSASVEEAEREQRGLKLLASPYVNPHPGVVNDLEWYKEALPGDGKTLVTWGPFAVAPYGYRAH